MAKAGSPTATPDQVARRTARRRLVLVWGALLGSAGALAGAARLPWFTAGVDAVGRGTVTVTATGADLVPALSAVALLAVAAVAAVVALAGPVRRVLGALVVLAGAGVGGAAVRLLAGPPTSADLAALPGAPAGGSVVDGSATPHVGPLVAVLGAVLLVAAGVALVVGERGLPRLGARYARAAAGAGPDLRTGADHATSPADADRPAPDRPIDADRPIDPDREAWDALDAGRDPTIDPERSTRPPGPPATRPSTASPTRAGRTDGGAPDRAV